jgi:hypothetical protein
LPFVTVLITPNSTPVIFYTMVYFTTFIFTLLLAHIAHAVPACGDVASPEDMYDHKQVVVLDDTSKVTWSDIYDTSNASTAAVTCSNFAVKYPTFGNFPDFPNLGAAFDIKQNPSNCGKCWKLTNQKSGRLIYFFAKSVFTKLSGGTVDPPILYAIAESVPLNFCGFDKR